MFEKSGGEVDREDYQALYEKRLNTKIARYIKKKDLNRAGHDMARLLKSAYDQQGKNGFRTTSLWCIKYYNEHLIGDCPMSMTDKNVQGIIALHNEKYCPHKTQEERKEELRYKSEYFNNKQLEELDDLFAEWRDRNDFKNNRTNQFIKEVRKALEEYSYTPRF